MSRFSKWLAPAANALLWVSFAISPTASSAQAVQITVVPGSISLGPGKSCQFTGSVSGTSNTTVTWSLAPEVGTVENGIYTAPATISAAQTVVLTATSAADPAKIAHASITLTPSVLSAGVSPNQTTLAPSESQQFSVTLSGSSRIGGGGPAQFEWSIFPFIGTITQDGLYTAPDSVSTEQAVTVTATRSAVSVSANVTLTPGSPPHSARLTWTVSDSPGVIGYNIYRGTISGGPYTKINTSLIFGTTFIDDTIVGGQLYFYVATAVDGSSNESYFSNEVQAVTPLP